ncbi:MAG TPA: carboxypeptidase-like regulatory domain-containing protein, partial [Pyrinomonadaceae bacterium]|nr:carboxypeptidase-like regulatory domain-containing protein [Pyrinomonadaceae bacterium]
RNDLNRIDLSKPIPADLDLVAEIILRDGGLEPRLFGGDDLATNENTIFDKLVKAQLSLLSATLNGQYDAQAVYPTDEVIMHRLLFASGVNFDGLRDPWGTPFRARFSVEQANDLLEIISAGADKRFDTSDDFVAARFTRPYFRFFGEAINRAGARFHAHTGRFIRDAATMQSELKREAINFDELRDPWGQPYRLRFDAMRTQYLVVVESSGPDQKFQPEHAPESDDFNVWTSTIDYSTDVRTRIDAALVHEFDATKHFPQNSAEFNATLAHAGIDANTLRDPWGRPFYPTFRQDARYTDRVVVESYAQYGQQPKERTEITPVAQSVNYITLRSAGPDGAEGTADDFDVATFMRIVTEQTAKDKTPQPTATPVQFTGGSGAISGTLTDPNGAVIANANVTATHKQSERTFTATSAENGKYLLRNLPTGLYEVRFAASGFKDMVIVDVRVLSQNLTKLDAQLSVGNIAETVEVTAGRSEVVNTTTAQVAELPINGRQLKNLTFLRPGINAVTKSGETQTPRLREYFPETLLWQPNIETDRSG